MGIIPSDVTFKRLHDTNQLSMDWLYKGYERMKTWGESQRYREFDIGFRNNLLKSYLKLKKTEKMGN